MVEHTFPWFGRNRLLAKDFENLAETQGQLRMEVWKGWVTGPSSEPLGTPRARRLRRFGEPGGTTKFDHQEQFAATRGDGYIDQGAENSQTCPEGDDGSCQLVEQRLGLF